MPSRSRVPATVTSDIAELTGDLGVPEIDVLEGGVSQEQALPDLETVHIEGSGDGRVAHFELAADLDAFEVHVPEGGVTRDKALPDLETVHLELSGDGRAGHV